MTHTNLTKPRRRLLSLSLLVMAGVAGSACSYDREHEPLGVAQTTQHLELKSDTTGGDPPPPRDPGLVSPGDDGDSDADDLLYEPDPGAGPDPGKPDPEADDFVVVTDPLAPGSDDLVTVTDPLPPGSDDLATPSGDLTTTLISNGKLSGPLATAQVRFADRTQDGYIKIPGQAWERDGESFHGGVDFIFAPVPDNCRIDWVISHYNALLSIAPKIEFGTVGGSHGVYQSGDGSHGNGELESVGGWDSDDGEELKRVTIRPNVYETTGWFEVTSFTATRHCE